jgi:hypothetical protein
VDSILGGDFVFSDSVDELRAGDDVGDDVRSVE